MSEKSYVTLEQHRCVACGNQFDTGALMLDKRLRRDCITERMRPPPEHLVIYVEPGILDTIVSHGQEHAHPTVQ